MNQSFGPTINLHEYQRHAVDFVKSHPFCGLFFDMGLGKSLITLTALYELNPSGNVLVIAPKNIARSTWIDEIRKWNFPLRFHSFIVDDKDKPLSKKKRMQAYADCVERTQKGEFAIYFINRELIADLIKNMPWIFPNVIIDEAQSFKSYSSQRFKALKSVRPRISRMVLLTGTPVPNGLLDLWAPIYLLDGGKRLGPNITSYRNRWFRVTKIINNHPVAWTPLPHADNEIHTLISDIVISAKNPGLKLPSLTMNEIRVPLSDHARQVYEELCDEFAAELEEAVMDYIEKNGAPSDRRKIYENLDPATAPNAAVLTGKLAQIASGSLYINEDHNYVELHDSKLEMALSIVENTSSPVLIAYHFRSDKEMLLKYFKDHKSPAVAFDGSAKMIRDWNQGNIPVMLVQPASAGHGLNLQDGGHTLIWYSLPWSLEEYLQCNARLYRQGQTHPVVIHQLIADQTVDEKILRALHNKDRTQRSLIDAVAADFIK